MKTQKISVLPLVSVIITVLLSAVTVLADVITGMNFEFTVAFGIVGLLIMVTAFFVKEKWLYNAALPMYAFFVIGSAYVLFFSDEMYSFSYRYITVGPVTVSSLCFLPFTVCLIAKLISSYKRFNLQWLLLILGAVAVIFSVLLLETHSHPLIMCVIAGIIIYIMMCKDKRITGPSYRQWYAPFLCLIIFTVALTTMRSYQLTRLIEMLKVVFTRGGSAPMTYGWTRYILDSVLSSALFAGESGFAEKLDTDLLLHESNFIVILIKYGWLAAAVLIALVAALIALIWKMTLKIKNSAFSRYVSLISAVIITVQFVYAILSVFLFAAIHIDLPFAGCSNSINLVNFILLGFIITCYTDRKNVSVIREEEIYDKNIIKTFTNVLSEKLKIVKKMNILKASTKMLNKMRRALLCSF